MDQNNTCSDDCKQKPHLVPTSSGFCSLNTIEYKNRLLYSKYTPARAIQTLVQNLQIMPGTLILINSPGLWYGIEELVDRLPEKCRLLAVECDPELFLLSQKQNDRKIPFYRFSTNDDIHLLDSDLHSFTENGDIRRAIKIDFCAGTQFHQDKYTQLLNVSTNLISSFWKNRVTLSKMGKLFARNIFRNLIKLNSHNSSTSYYNSVEKPILVVGAGESIDGFDWNDADKYHILAVDAALQPLQIRGIKPDSIICVESQLAIEKMFIGTNTEDSDIFLDISSRASLAHHTKNAIYFATKYSENDFLNRLHDNRILQDFFTPNGSVGLTAVELALKLRKDNTVPVYILGLDFSYSIGKTHGKNVNGHITQLIKHNRLKSIENYDASFGTGAFVCTGKDGSKIASSMILSSYATSFRNCFSQIPNIFDASRSGMELGLSYRKEKSICLKKNIQLQSADDEKLQEKIISFYKQEKSDLLALLDLLKNGDQSEFRNANSLEEQLKELLYAKDYLWLHFPDGTSLSLDSSFLKRIRAEIIYFIKQIDTALSI